jgi:hypothetical protein
MLASNLTVHSNISRLILHGSRGLKGSYRSDSDVDLSLIVDELQGLDGEHELQEVLEVTLSHWQAPVEADLAVIFDVKTCSLSCFEQIIWNEQICQPGGTDCFGLYKTKKDFMAWSRMPECA